MKIGILTHHYVKNYGAFLQMKGMYETLQRLYPEAEVTVINYVNQKHWRRNIIHILHFRPGVDTLSTYVEKIRQLRTFTKYERSIPRTRPVKTAKEIIDLKLDLLLSNVAVYFIVWIVLELNCRKLIGSKNDGNTFSFDELIKNIKAGILLTVGNLSSVVLTSMDRWFVKALMTTLAFAQYSFAVSMENFMNVAVTPVTTTLYNYFCKATDEVKVRKARNYVMIFAALIVSCAFPARFILEVYLTKYIDSAKVMFLLFAAQIFYIVIKSIYVNLYKAQKKQSIYFIKLTAIIVVGFVFNVICYNLYKVKESFAVGTLLSAVCWYFLCLPDFKWIKYNTKEKLYPFIQTCAFLVCGFCFSAIPGFFIYIFEIMVVTWISFPKETKFIINEAKSKLAHLK